MKINIRLYSISQKMNLFDQYSIWRDFCMVMFYLKQHDELTDLIEWASRKRLSKVKHHYNELLMSTIWRIRRHKTYSPRIVLLAEWIHCVRQMLFPPQYHAGYAGKYQTRK